MGIKEPFLVSSIGIILALTGVMAASQETTSTPGQAVPEGPAASRPNTPAVHTPSFNVAPPPPAENDFKVSSDVEVVLLDVSVKDANGGFASGLHKDSFKVYENKVEQPITIFAAQ